MNNIIIDMTKSALSNTIYTHTVDDEKEIFRLLKENGLFGLVGPYLDEKRFSSRFNQLKTAVLYDYIRKDEIQQKLIQKVDSLLNEHKIAHVFLKGSRIKPLYPKTYMRGMGDIDILVHESMLKNVEKIFLTYEIVLEQRSPAHDFYRTKESEIIEIHPRLYNDFNPKYKLLFELVWEDATCIKEYRYELEHTFELLYLINHLAKHLASSGIGLRSLLDISIYLNAYENKIDQKLLEHYLRETHMTKLFMTILFLNQHYFNLTSKLFDTTFSLDEHQINRITTYIMTSGIHGSGSNFNEMAPRRVKNKSRFKVLLKVAFPKFKDLKVMYPILDKVMFLYPFCITHRLFKLIFVKRKQSFSKIKKLDVDKESVEEIAKVFNDLGL